MINGNDISGEMTFEAAMKRIEEIMSLLDDKKISLEKSIDLYTESMGLIAFCNKKLEEAENKIRVITSEGEKDFQ